MSREPIISDAHINAMTENLKKHRKARPVVTRRSEENISKPDVYTLVVNDVSLRELLFSLARDAKLNIDIHEAITGKVTISAFDKTLHEIMARLENQLDIRYSLEGNHLSVYPDWPYFESYKIDYVNLRRKSTSRVRVATTLGSTGSNNIGSNKNAVKNDYLDNSSLTEIKNESENDFWKSLKKNIAFLIAVKNKGDNSKRIILNRESGVVIVKATKKQHGNIKRYIDLVVNNASRQVMIEITIAEIKLSNRFQSGVDWSMMSKEGGTEIDITTDLRGVELGQSPFTSLSIRNNKRNNLSITLRALERFGDVKVLSSPRVMAINNQPAILKVVDNFVYFELNVKSSINTNISVTTFDTEIKSVPVGFVMTVTPYISENNEVTLNIRPTISRIIDTVEDPNPEFKRANVSSQVPVIQIREIESILKVDSGNTAVIGGLMQDTIKTESVGIPFLSSLPLIGGLFSYQDKFHEKSELIIFIRPIVVEHDYPEEYALHSEDHSINKRVIDK